MLPLMPLWPPAAEGLSCNQVDKNACFGNGVCLTPSVGQQPQCLCNPGWKGESCSRLDTLPLRGEAPGLKQGGEVPPTWGASGIFDKGMWHFFAGAKVDGGNPSDLFNDNSGILHMRAKEPGGPYENLGELKSKAGGSFGMHADVKRHPKDGSLLLVTVGFVDSERFGFVILRSASGSADGPWTEHLVFPLGRKEDPTKPDSKMVRTADPSSTDNMRWDCRMAGPTLAVLGDGTSYIAYRGTRCAVADALIGAWGDTGEHEVETAGMLRAQRWDGPYDRIGPPIFPPGTDSAGMYLWASPLGLHILFHSQNNTRFNHNRRGGFAFSAGLGAPHFSVSTDDAWDTHLTFDDCQSSPLAKRQQPSLLFHPKTKKPTHLLTGVAAGFNGPAWGDSWTAMQVLNDPTSGQDLSCPISKKCCTGGCPPGSIGGGGSCRACTDSDMPKCKPGYVTSGPSHHVCMCMDCLPAPPLSGKPTPVGFFCETPGDSEGKQCPVEGYDLLPGTSNGDVFRCGLVDGGAPTGNFKKCVPAGSRCSVYDNCGDGSGNHNCYPGYEKYEPCIWPYVRTSLGKCSPCLLSDIPKCLEAGPADWDRDTCVCYKCTKGWFGRTCEIDAVTLCQRTRFGPTCDGLLHLGLISVHENSSSAAAVQPAALAAPTRSESQDGFLAKAHVLLQLSSAPSRVAADVTRGGSGGADL